MSTPPRSSWFARAAVLALTLGFGLACGVHDRTGKDAPSSDGNAAAGTGTGMGATGKTGARDAGTMVGQASGGSRATGAGGSGNGSANGSGGSGLGSGSGGSGSSGMGMGTSGSGQSGADAAGAGGSAMAGNTPEDSDCDLNGIWIARLTSFSLDDVVQSVQTASSWYYYELTQNGRDVTVTAALDCGIQVSGSANVTLNDDTTKALLTRNDQTGRKGNFYKDGDHCALTIDRFYSTRGVPRATYLPADLSSKPDLTTITPPLPTMAMPAGAEDWDGDGQPGIAFNVSGAVMGTRHVVQRDWNEFASDASDSTYQPPLNANEFVVRAQFDSSEQILATTGGALAGLLAAGSAPQHGAKHRITWKRLGRSADDATVKAIRVDDSLQSCRNVQSALPHDSASM